MTLFIPGLGEELGWRGFLLPRLQRIKTPIIATLILAIVHLLWHLPTYWLGQGIHNVPFIYVTLFIFPWTIIYNWIYNHSNGSLIFAVGFHTISNASLNFVYFMPTNKDVPIEPSLLTKLGLPIEYSGSYLSVIAVYWVVALSLIAFGGLKKGNTDI